jgi:hypothetical protein
MKGLRKIFGVEFAEHLEKQKDAIKLARAGFFPKESEKRRQTGITEAGHLLAEALTKTAPSSVCFGAFRRSRIGLALNFVERISSSACYFQSPSRFLASEEAS